MAKLTPTSPSNRSKVRLFFVDADLAPGDMHELTNALTTAIRPTHVVTRAGVVQQIAPPTSTPTNGGNGHAASEQTDLLDEQLQTTDEHEEPGVAVTPKTPATPRTFRKPQPVDIDMQAGGKPFLDFVAEKRPSSHRDKHLVAAAWLHEYAKRDPITVDDIYTCYKVADWTFDVSDPTVILRGLKKESVGALKQGKFSINHIGLAEVHKMKAAG